MTVDTSSISVLCVDDEPGLADLVATYLERSDEQLTTTTATSAREGLDHLQTRSIDCIVSDYNMPGIDGLGFLEAVRADHPDLPFILFTGQGSEEIASDAISAGVTDYMQKGPGTDQYEVLAQRIRNVVEHHRARTRHVEAKQRAQTILNASPDAVLVSIDAEFVYANPAAVELFHADSEADLLGRSTFELVHPDDRDDVEAAMEAIATSEQPVTRVSRTAQTLDGESVPVEVTGRQITWDGQDAVVAIIRDLSTAEKLTRTQERYRAAFKQASDGMAIIDDEGRYIDVNPRLCELLGVNRDDLIGATLAETVPEQIPEDEEFDLDDAWEAFKTTGERRETLQIQRPDGETQIVESAAIADIVPGEHLVITRDVTEREERLAEIEAQNERLEGFAGVVSHDLRNPLNVAQGRAELAREECDSDHLPAVVSALERSQALIDDVLTLAREGESVTDVEAVDLAEAMSECWQNVRTADATLVTDTKQTIQADASRLRQLVENLIRNAVEHGGADVTVTIGELEDGFYVADDGAGIPEDVREQVFDPGYSTSGEATGFGLNIVKQIVDAHGWEISVTDSDEGGARFEITGVRTAEYALSRSRRF